jgi:toxin ParE1/3/4
MNYRFDDPAIVDIDVISGYYSRIGRQFCARFIEDIYRQILLISESPRLGREIGNGFRRVLLQRFPYTVIYEVDVETDTVLIVTVGHQRRRPGYWRDHVQEEPAIYQLVA